MPFNRSTFKSTAKLGGVFIAHSKSEVWECWSKNLTETPNLTPAVCKGVSLTPSSTHHPQVDSAVFRIAQRRTPRLKTDGSRRDAPASRLAVGRDRKHPSSWGRGGGGQNVCRVCLQRMPGSQAFCSQWRQTFVTISSPWNISSSRTRVHALKCELASSHDSDYSRTRPTRARTVGRAFVPPLPSQLPHKSRRRRRRRRRLRHFSNGQPLPTVQP